MIDILNFYNSGKLEKVGNTLYLDMNMTGHAVHSYAAIISFNSEHCRSMQRNYVVQFTI